MIVSTRFPDLPPRPETSANAAFRRAYFARWGRENMVFLASTANFESMPLTSQLSIKLVDRGQALLRVGRRELLLEPGRCVVVNEGETYAVRIADERPVRGFSLHFRPGLAAEVQAARGEGWERALGDGAAPRQGRSPRLGDALHAPSAGLLEVLESVRRLALSGERDGAVFEPLFIAALDRLLDDDEGERQHVASRLDAVRASTRDELRRRAGWAQDYILGNYAEPIALGDIAAAAHLSKYHLLRVYRQVHGVTPLEALRTRRAEVAAAMLRDGHDDLAAVAGSVGFGSRWAMQRALRAAFGATGRELLRRPAEA
jgi:AraC-like DNA-binding protein